MTVDQSDIEVDVCDGGTLVLRWPCSRTAMPDGAPGVIWRGVAYPLLANARIDVAAPAASPAPRIAVVTGAEASWILLQGLPATLDAARKAIERSGIAVSRSGRWLGDLVDGVAYDWFIRCQGAIDEAAVWTSIGAPPARSAEAAGSELLEQRIADLLAQLAQRAAAEQHATAMSVSDAPLIAALGQEIETLRQRVAAPPPPTPPPLKLYDEVAGMLQALRPDVTLLRDSLTVVLGEFASRSGFYRAVRDLPLSGSRPDGWKLLHGADRWWERHVSTGRDDAGRAYARFEPESRCWSLLVSWKGEQAWDIDWLRRQS
jgi:hypothetical protein